MLEKVVLVVLVFCTLRFAGFAQVQQFGNQPWAQRSSETSESIQGLTVAVLRFTERLNQQVRESGQEALKTRPFSISLNSSVSLAFSEGLLSNLSTLRLSGPPSVSSDDTKALISVLLRLDQLSFSYPYVYRSPDINILGNLTAIIGDNGFIVEFEVIRKSCQYFVVKVTVTLFERIELRTTGPCDWCSPDLVNQLQEPLQDALKRALWNVLVLQGTISTRFFSAYYCTR